jgi:fumarylacetoacetate (FAA) hydrolase
MKLASLKSDNYDGRLVIVSEDLSRAVFANGIVDTMIEALENWDSVHEALQHRYIQLNKNNLNAAFEFDPKKAAAPLPRCYQFVDASAFNNHGDIIEKAYNLDVEKDDRNPILIQRQSDDFRGPHDDYFLSENDQCDFEGEFAVITGEIPMGASEAEAETQIKLITIINDVSMRGHMIREKNLGFGFIQAKPATVFAPVAVTPDELGDSWSDGRIHLDFKIERSGEWFGHPNGREMDFSFGYLLKHLAYNRTLKPGAILGSGTVSNKNCDEVGSACLVERRALEKIKYNEIKSDWIQSGESIRMEVFNHEGMSVFGAIDHKTIIKK